MTASGEVGFKAREYWEEGRQKSGGAVKRRDPLDPAAQPETEGSVGEQEPLLRGLPSRARPSIEQEDRGSIQGRR